MQGQAITPQRQELPLAPAGGGGSNLEQSALTPGGGRAKSSLRNEWVILACPRCWVILVASYFAFLSVPLYEAVAQIDIDLGRSTNIGINDLIEQKLGGEDASSERLETEVAIMRSNTVALDVMNALDLYHKVPFSDIFKGSPYNGHLSPSQRSAMIGTFSGNLKIMIIPGTNLVEVRYRNPDPKLATSVTNAILDAYMERDLRARFEGTNRVSNWLAGQLNTLKKQVEDSQQQVAKYQRENNLVGMNAEGDTLVTENLRTVNQQLAEAQADRIVKEARYRLAQTRNPELLVSVAPGTTLTSLRQQQSELMVQYAQLKSKFGPDWPKVKEAEKQLAAVQANIDTEINSITNRFEEEYNASVKTENLLSEIAWIKSNRKRTVQMSLPWRNSIS